MSVHRCRRVTNFYARTKNKQKKLKKVVKNGEVRYRCKGCGLLINKKLADVYNGMCGPCYFNHTWGNDASFINQGGIRA